MLVNLSQSYLHIARGGKTHNYCAQSTWNFYFFTPPPFFQQCFVWLGLFWSHHDTECMGLGSWTIGQGHGWNKGVGALGGGFLAQEKNTGFTLHCCEQKSQGSALLQQSLNDSGTWGFEEHEAD